VQNSWGSSWGAKGYIKIKRGGANNCKIESYASAALPATKGFSYKNGKAVISSATASKAAGGVFLVVTLLGLVA